jgi:hypothetical protein
MLLIVTMAMWFKCYPEKRNMDTERPPNYSELPPVFEHFKCPSCNEYWIVDPTAKSARSKSILHAAPVTISLSIVALLTAIIGAVEIPTFVKLDNRSRDAPAVGLYCPCCSYCLSQKDLHSDL